MAKRSKQKQHAAEAHSQPPSSPSSRPSSPSLVPAPPVRRPGLLYLAALLYALMLVFLAVMAFGT